MDQRLAKCDQWLERRGPFDHIVVSTRARYARNLPRVPFPRHAQPQDLKAIHDRIAEAINRNHRFVGGLHFELDSIGAKERHFLRECHLISREMEKHFEHRAIYVSPDVRLAVMANEEDHLRMYALEAGFQPYEVLNRLNELESELGSELGFAFSERFGYLTACPTNAGTGLRVSVMLHLPGLALTDRMAEILKAMPQYGMTVRGFYGEHSDNQGNFFQLSNEVTLGLDENEIVARFKKIVEDVITQEEGARQQLFEHHGVQMEDKIWRAFGIVAHARVMSSNEALGMLNLLRLGVDRGFFRGLDHNMLNRLAIEVQPSHIEMRQGVDGSENRDVARAKLLRERLSTIIPRN